MTREEGQLGLRALKLLGEESMLAVLRGLADGALRPAQLDRSLPDVAHSVIMRRLRHLLDSQLVGCEHRSGLPPHAHRAPIPREARYELSEAGRALMEVTVEARRWERTWCSQAERRGAPGALAIALSADEQMREIRLLLADGPLSTTELDGRTRLGRSALRRRLRELVLGGLLKRRDGGRIPLVYELADGARHLALVAMVAARWEWQWSRPEHPAPGRDLGALLHTLAPVARVPEPMAGICRLHLDARGADEPDIYLAVRDGGVRALPGAPVQSPDAVGHATAAAWCGALLRREGLIAMSGDEELLATVIGAMNQALLT